AVRLAHQVEGCRRLVWLDRLLIGDQLVPAVPSSRGRFQTQGRPRQRADALNLVGFETRALSQLVERRLAPQQLAKLAGALLQLPDALQEMSGNADGMLLEGEGALHGLADPPRAVGAELESAAVLVLLHRAYQPQ